MIPQQKITITHDSTDYSFEGKTIQWDVTLRENMASEAGLITKDKQAANFLEKCDVFDNIKIEFRYKDQTDSWTQLFGGWITDAAPELAIESGSILKVLAIGYEQALVNMLVWQQYGSESIYPHSGQTTLQQILTNTNYGIIPKYVKKVMKSSTDSGYENTIDTTKIPDVTSAFRYLYFAGKPAIKCLQDMIDLISAANAPNAGAHWTCIHSGTTGYLCVATVGNHETPVPADIWPTWWNPGATEEESRTLSTIDVKKEMVTSTFQKKRSQGNYVLYNGYFRRPSDGDKWTDGNADDWDVYSTGDADGIIENEPTVRKIGAASIRIREPDNAHSIVGYYPSDCDLDINVTYIESRSNVPHIGFYAQRNANVYVGGGGPDMPQIWLGTGDFGDSDYYYAPLLSYLPESSKWYHISLPIGNYHNIGESADFEWYKWGDASWNDIDYVAFLCSASVDDCRFYVDGMRIEGMLTRAAYDSNKFPTQRCRMVTIRDNVPKDDKLIATDDSGEMAQFAKAELRRAIYTPIVGQICVKPLKDKMRAGQLARIRFGQKSDGTYAINKDMRITSVRHHFGMDGAKSFLDLTDDVKNSRAMGLADAYELLLKATSPQFQDRILGSLVSGDLDVTATILEKPYDTSTW